LRDESSIPAFIPPGEAAERRVPALRRVWNGGRERLVRWRRTVLVLAGIAAYIAWVGWESQRSFNVGPFGVTRTLADSGFTGDVAAAEFRDALDELEQTAGRSLPGLAIPGSVTIPDTEEAAKLPDVEIPGVGISFETVGAFIRGFFPTAWRHDVTGEFTDAGTQLTLRVRYNGHAVLPTREESGPGAAYTLLKEAGMGVLEALYQQMIDAKPPAATAALLHLYRGHVLDLDNHGDDAKKEYAIAANVFAKEYSDAIALNPHDAKAYVGLGSALIYQSNLPDAVTSYNKAIELDPNNAEAHLGLGQALFGIGIAPATPEAERRQVLLKACQALIDATKLRREDPDAVAIINTVSGRLAQLSPPGTCSPEH